ncbi:heterokaryon incompatibility protein Het-C-domain-containing protein [Phyllosticta citricarpa]
MPTLRLSPTFLLSCLVLLVFLATPGSCFGAGNVASVSRIEGINWRHGDIEDTLLNILMGKIGKGKKFSKMDVKRVYFGNWLRDYSQAVGALKMVSSEAIRLLLWILGFMSFGFATGEFEVTRDRIGCYRPEEHIDNPKDYADNMDAREYDRRLRGPVDEEVELAVDERSGLKNYIANERARIDTSAGLVRKLFGRSIELARRYRRDGNKEDFYEALRLLGTGTHCLEDFSAHSNYTELALIELGERDVFPHVGSRTKVEVEGKRIWPCVTGTFGGVDFLHSVMGEVNDKATQSEVQELEGAISNAQSNHEAKSMVKDLLSQLPDGLLGGDNASKADEMEETATAGQMENMDINPKDPEAFVEQMEQIRRQIYPILEWHDNLMQSINEAIEKVPVLPDLLEKFSENMSIFVFSLIAPFILPVIQQVKAELQTGSSEVIQSSADKQHIVFNDDSCSDPTHSMLAKDHFSNVLNEPAGNVASQVLKWAIPQIVECWDNEDIDADRTISRIIDGVLHHPALRDYGEDGASEGRQLMFRVVEQWWEEKDDSSKDDFRERLSREGVEQGRNHREGVQDSGHGCGKPLGMSSSITGGNYSQQSSNSGNKVVDHVGNLAGEAVGGGALGGMVGGLVGNVLGGVLDNGKSEKKEYESQGYGGDDSRQESYMQTSRQRRGSGEEDRYGQSEYRREEYGGGRGEREEYSRYEQEGRSGGGFQTSVEERNYGSGGYERRQEERYDSYGGDYETRRRTEGYGESGDYYKRESRDYGRRSDDDEDSDEEKRRKKEEKRRKKEEKERRRREEGDYDSEDSNDSKKHHRRKSGSRERRSSREREYRGDDGYGMSSGYGGAPSSQGYGGRSEYSGRGGDGYGGRSEEYGRSEYSSGGGYGGRSEEYGRSEYSSGGGYGGRSEEYGRSEYSSGGGYGGRSEEYGRSQYSGGGGGEYGSRSDEYGRGSSGYGGGDEYGRGPPGGFGGEDEYGRGPPGGFGGEDEYGRPRRENQGGGGYGGGYGGGGYSGGY